MNFIRSFFVHRFAPYVHKVIARNSLLFNLSVSVRNQCNCVLASKVSDGVDFRYNGELEIIDAVSKHCTKFADIGANVGEWTKLMLKHASPGTTGYAFEPNPSYHKILYENLKELNVEVNSCALSDKVSERPFYLDGRSSRIQQSSSDNNVIKVQTDTLDNIFKSQILDFVKIDCEGHDFKVIYGADNMLKEHRIKFLQFEYNSFWLEQGSSLFQANSFLETREYSLFRIHKRGLHKIDYNRLGDYFRYSNYLATHRKDIHYIENLLLP